MAVGQKDFARAVAAELIRRSAEWVNIPAYGWDYTPLSYGSLLWALDRIDDDDYEAVIKQYRNALLALQGIDGSWDDQDHQTTAYAVLGLSEAKGRGSKDALSKAGTFLISSQADNGGWVGPWGEYGEVNSEVLMALAELVKGGHNNLRKEKVHRKESGEHREKKEKHLR